MAVDTAATQQILQLIPQQSPFRFIDAIAEVDSHRIVGTYRFRDDEYFYRGHFPNRPITPGVILIETMAQTGVVAFGIYLLLQEDISPDHIRHMVTLFATVDEVEFSSIVMPGETVTIRGEKVYFRRGTIKTRVSIEKQDGEIACYGILTGRGVTINET